MKEKEKGGPESDSLLAWMDLLLFASANHTRILQKGMDMEPIRIFAHRGFSAAAPENTMAAFRLAAEAGATAWNWMYIFQRTGK